MKDVEVTVEVLERFSQKEQTAFVNLLAGAGAEQALRRIEETRLTEKLWLRNYKELGLDKYRKKMIEGLVFFPGERNRKELKERLETLFGVEPEDRKKETLSISLMKKAKRNMPFSVDTRNRILLEISLDKYTVPFFLELKSYREIAAYPIDIRVEDSFTDKKSILCCGFPAEEYLAQGLYEILDKLELLNDFTWYQEVYDILAEEPVEGRKVRDSLAKMIEKKPLPSLEKRLDTLKTYADYGYMEKKWKNQCKRREGEHPKWSEVVKLITICLQPLYESILKDEIFFGDWMPHLGRYL